MLQCINQTILQDPDSWLHDRLLKLCDMELVSHSIISLFCKLAICKSGWRIPLLILLILQTCNLQIWMRIPFLHSAYFANLQFENPLPVFCLFCKSEWEFPSCIGNRITYENREIEPSWTVLERSLKKKNLLLILQTYNLQIWMNTLFCKPYNQRIWFLQSILLNSRLLPLFVPNTILQTLFCKHANLQNKL